MSTTNKSVCKLCRREASKLFLKGERCFSDKCAYERRPYPPGIFGAGRRIRVSEFGVQLREKQKAKRTYMMREAQFRRMYEKALHKKGVKSLNFLRMLELRMDNVCLRMGLANSISQARQLVKHGHVTVNDQVVSIPSYQCCVQDVVKVKSKSQEMLAVKEALENAKRKTRPDWLSFDESKTAGTITRVPEREDINIPVNERFIVELYSK